MTQVELFEYHNARPLKSLFPTLEQGFGVNNTGQWTDYNVLLVNDGFNQRFGNSYWKQQQPIFNTPNSNRTKWANGNVRECDGTIYGGWRRRRLL